MVGVDGADDAPADLAQLPGLGLGQRVEDQAADLLDVAGRVPDPADGRYTLATLTGQGQAKVTQAAPGHVQEVRRLVFDPLTKTQSRQLREIGRRITRAIDPDDQPVPAALPAQAPQ